MKKTNLGPLSNIKSRDKHGTAVIDRVKIGKHFAGSIIAISQLELKLELKNMFY